jgi:ABC-type Na+ efflux pump permease subunit
VTLAAAATMLSLLLALDGESVNNGNAGLAVAAVVSVVLGYLLLGALWYFVFRDKARRKRGKDSSD